MKLLTVEFDFVVDQFCGRALSRLALPSNVANIVGALLLPPLKRVATMQNLTSFGASQAPSKLEAGVGLTMAATAGAEITIEIRRKIFACGRQSVHQQKVLRSFRGWTLECHSADTICDDGIIT